MMDIGAYESDQMVHHSTNYHNIDSSYDYDYYQSGRHVNNQNIFTTNNSLSNGTQNSVSIHPHHPHLYSSAATEFGINVEQHSANHNFTTFDNSPSQQYYLNSNSNGSSGPHSNGQTSLVTHPNASPIVNSPMPPVAHLSSNNLVSDAYVISSDNGLSYANLDLIYNPPANATSVHHLHDDHKPPFGASSSPVENSEMVTRSLNQHTISSSMIPTGWNGHYPSPYGIDYSNDRLPHYGDSSTGVGLNAMTKDCGASRLSNARSNSHLNEPRKQQMPSQQQPQQPQQPTYKWMQVKRNVPKPPGNFRKIGKRHISCGRNISIDRLFKANRKFVSHKSQV